MKFENRYQRNFNTLLFEEMEKLKNCHVCVVGCGGLGGYLVEMLARIGIGQITAIDGAVFEESNFNRQILSQEHLLGKSKALTAKSRVEAINSEVNCIAVPEFLTKENGNRLIRGRKGDSDGFDLVMDGLDGIKARLLLAEFCEEAEIPLIHGAIAGWFGQVSVIFPGDGTMERLYPNRMEHQDHGAERELGNPSFIPAVVAGIQVSQGIKVLLERGEDLRGQLLSIDLLSDEYLIFDA